VDFHRDLGLSVEEVDEFESIFLQMSLLSRRILSLSLKRSSYNSRSDSLLMSILKAK